MQLREEVSLLLSPPSWLPLARTARIGVHPAASLQV